MKHKKEWYSCDRCGAEIEKSPKDCMWESFSILKRVKAAELEVLTAERCGFIKGDLVPIPDVDSITIEIMAYYNTHSKTMHLCGKCKKDFKKFMENAV